MVWELHWPKISCSDLGSVKGSRPRENTTSDVTIVDGKNMAAVKQSLMQREKHCGIVTNGASTT